MVHRDQPIPLGIVAEASVMRVPQFSLRGLLLTVLAVGVALGAARWAGLVWIVPLMAGSLAAGSLAMAVRRGTSWRTLKPGWWHAAVWLVLSTAATGMAANGCLRYNEIAGTDKSSAHIARICAAMLAGPLVGPVANPGAGEAPQARRWAAVLFAAWCLAAGPFLVVRRTVAWPVAAVCWAAYMAASVLWFFAALISLGVFLS
jgi:hypothetical protein